MFLVTGIDRIQSTDVLGHRFADADFAIVFVDNVGKTETDQIMRTLRSVHSTAYDDMSWGVAPRQATAFREFQRLVPKLFKKDFEGLSRAQVLQKIIDVTVAHEALHVADRDQDYSYAEEEIRALYAELSSGVAPYYSLAFFAQNVFRDIDQRAGLENLMKLAKQHGKIKEDIERLTRFDFVTLNKILESLSSEALVSRDDLASFGRLSLDKPLGSRATE